MPKKNIVLFSDGTGNQGGTDSDTNVFKLYNAVALKDSKVREKELEQLTYYDNGVGTSKHIVWRALGGAFGLGFRRNVRDLYEFLARNYQEGDDIYVFGFSRGAATVRAFIGMVDKCGLIQKEDLNEEDFQNHIDAAMNLYIKQGRGWSIRKILQSFGLWRKYPNLQERIIKGVKVEFLGVWDTVAALGFKQLGKFDNFVNFFRQHNFYNYDPHSSVKNIYHAMAVDDERRTFWPLVWDEKQFKKHQESGEIEQVWFSGVHSNVGGGYPRAGLANITLDWMIGKLKAHEKSAPNGGLILKPALAIRAYEDANTNGKIYDSRGGAALLYRYQPRPIKEEFERKVVGAVRIHESVFERMKYRTAGYTPVMIPGKFDMVNSANEVVRKVNLEGVDLLDYLKIRKCINRLKNYRIILYWIFLLSVLALVAVSGFLWWKPPLEWGNLELWKQASGINGFLGHVADILRYVLPDFFEGAITYAVIQHPWWFGSIFIWSGILYLLRFKLKTNMEGFQEDARIFILNKIQ